MTPDEYSRILARIQQLKLSQQVVNSVKEHSIGDVPEAMHAVWSPQTHHGVRTVNPFRSAQFAHTVDSTLASGTVVVPNGEVNNDTEVEATEEVKEVASLFQSLQCRLVARGTFVDDTASVMQSILADSRKCHRVLACTQCMRQETEAAFHHFVHLIAKGKQMQVFWSQTEWDRRAALFQRVNVDNLVTHRKDRWNHHVWGSSKHRFGTGDAIVSLHLVVKVCRTTVLPLLERRVWTITDVPVPDQTVSPQAPTVAEPVLEACSCVTRPVSVVAENFSAPEAARLWASYLPCDNCGNLQAEELDSLIGDVVDGFEVETPHIPSQLRTLPAEVVNMWRCPRYNYGSAQYEVIV